MSHQILVVGSLNRDDAVRVPRFPGPGETLSARSVTSALGGKGANQAVAAARAGARVRMVGAVGAGDGADLLAALDADGVDTGGVQRLDRTPTGRAIVMIDDAAENSIVIVPGANHAIDDAAVADACRGLRAGDVVLLQNEIPAVHNRRAARLAREAGATVIWNAAPAPTAADELVDDAHLLLVNEHELASLAALHGTGGDDTAALMAAIAAATGADVICTLGADGAAFLLGGATGTADARRVEAVDTTAAGDTFAGYYAAGTDLPAPQRLRRALDAASLAVTRPGASSSIPHRPDVVPTADERNTAI